jgi:hypothetical protein
MSQEGHTLDDGILWKRSMEIHQQRDFNPHD